MDVQERISALPRPLRSVVEIGQEMWREWHDDRVGGLAAEVAFFAVLSVFPGMVALAAALGSLEHLVGPSAAADVERAVLDFLRTTLDLKEDSTALEAFEGLFRGASPGVFTVGLIGALWAMSRGFTAVVRALDVAYDLDERRSYPKQRGLAVALSLGSLVVGAIVLTAMVVGPLLGAGEELADTVGLGSLWATLWTFFRLPVAFLVLVGYTATVFHIAPNHRTPWRADVWGALASSVLALLLSFAFRAYLEVAVGANEVFGVLGGALSLLVWLYLMSLSLLAGGELNAILWARKGEDKAEGAG